MKASEFPEANTRLLPPEGQEDQVYALSIWRHPHGNVVISQWKPTWRDRLRILIGRPLWLHVLGPTHPPLTIETDYPFEEDPEKGKGPRMIVLLITLMAVGYVFAYMIIHRPF